MPGTSDSKCDHVMSVDPTGPDITRRRHRGSRRHTATGIRQESEELMSGNVMGYYLVMYIFLCNTHVTVIYDLYESCSKLHDLYDVIHVAMVFNNDVFLINDVIYMYVT